MPQITHPIALSSENSNPYYYMPNKTLPVTSATITQPTTSIITTSANNMPTTLTLPIHVGIVFP